MFRIGRSTLAALAAVVVSALPLCAQFRAGITGTITDPTGSVVPGVKLTLTNEETQRKTEATSNNAGIYRFDSLAPGRYNVTAEHKGFQATSEEVQVQAEAVQQANIALQTGSVTSTVTVTAESSPSIETTNGNVGRALTTQEVLRLPQIGRSPYELLRLTPGIFGDGARSGSGQSVRLPNTSAGSGGSNVSLFQTENQTPISADGQRVSANNYLLDGVSVNSLGYGGAAVVTPNQESVKEVRVNANAYSAEFGRNSGAQIETVTQNGTDHFHGSAVFLYQDPNFNAYNKPSLHSIPVTRVENAFRNYAASLGGPVVKQRLFFFFSFEGLHDQSATFENQYVETPQFDQAVLAQRPNSIAAKLVGATGNAPRVAGIIPQTACPASEPTCRVVNGEYDLGSIGGTPGTYFRQGSGGAGLDGIPDVEYAILRLPQSNFGRQYNGRVDWSSGNNYIAGSTFVTTLDTTQADFSAGGRPNTDSRITPLNSEAYVLYTHTFTPTLLNEARANFTRFSYNQLQTSSLTNYGLPDVQIQFQGVPQIQYGADAGDTSPAQFAQNTYEFRDTVDKQAGNHSLKFGFELRREQDNNNLVGSARPIYAIQDLYNFANDVPVFESLIANPLTGAPSSAQRYFRTGVYALFAEDQWKVTPSLTLNFGLRWEYFTSPTEKRGQLYNWVPGPGFGNIDNSSDQHVSQLYNSDTNNIAPRFGFAYNPGKAPWFVMRGGFGVFFNRLQDSLFDLTREDAPTFARYNLCCGGIGNGQSYLADNSILYSLGASNSIYSYPVNPALATGINPLTNTPNPLPSAGPNASNPIEVYAVPKNFATPYVYIYSLETDFQLPHSYVFTLGYQGSDSHKLVQLVNQKFLYPTVPNSPGGNSFSAIYQISPVVNANYNALNATLSKTLSNGIQFQQNFRWAKSLDTNSYEGPGADTNSTYPQDAHQDYALSDFDTKFNYTASGLYQLPFYRDQKGVLGKLLGGWEINPIFTFHTGFPWTPKTGQNIETPGGIGLSPVRPYAYLGGALTGQSNSAFLRANGNFPGGGSQYFLYTLPSGLTTAAPGIGRNVFRGPWYKSVDFSIGKITRIPNKLLGEGTQLETRINLFNAFNQQNFQPFQYGDIGTFVDSPQFGQPTQELAGRVVELQARFSF